MGNDTITAIPRNPYMGAAADTVRGVRDYGNRARVPDAVPLLGGMGVGDMLVGQAPEELDRWAHGFTPFKDRSVPGYSGLRGIPELQPNRVGPVVDTLFLGADATGAGAGLRALGKTGAKTAARGFDNLIDDTGRDASRRAFVKKAGIVGAGAAAAAATPRVLKTVAKAIVPEPTTVATRVAKNALGSVPEYYRALRQAGETFSNTFRAKQLDLMHADPKYLAIEQKYNDVLASRKAMYAEANPNGPHFDDAPENMDDVPDEFWELDEIRDAVESQASQYARDAEEQALDAIRKANPDYADLPRRAEDVYDPTTRSFPPEFLQRTGLLPDDNAVFNHLKKGGEYIDPTTGNKARLIEGAKPHGVGHKGTRHDIEWESPSGQVSPYQHWLPRYVPDEDIGKYTPDGRLNR